MAQVVEHLPNNCEALSSNPITAQNQPTNQSTNQTSNNKRTKHNDLVILYY
jgi:hypothetical protein